MKREYQSIDNSELEDFETECRSRGFNPKNFTLKEHDITHTPISSVIYNVNGQVTITHQTISRTYNTGNATHWVADFADDLRAGIFNKN